MKKISNPIAVLLAIFLTLSGVIVPTLLATAISPSTASPAASQNPSQISSTIHSPGKAIFIGTVDVASISPSVENSQLSSTPHILGFHASSSGSSSLATTAPLAHGGGGGSSVVSIINSFEGIDFGQSGGYVPPDVIIATGPNHILEMNNLVGKVFNRQGAAIKTFGLSSFFNSGNLYLSDPKVLYDAPSGRWFSSIITSSNGFASGNVEIAVSNSNDPTGTWQLYQIVVNDFVPDQPLIGVSDDKFIVSANIYAPLFLGTGQGHTVFEGAQYWVLNKSELLAGAATVDYDSIGPDPSLESVFPVQSLSPTTTQYMVTVGAGDISTSSTSVKLLSITGVPPSTVTVTSTSLTIAAASPPQSIIQPGTNTSLTTVIDQRVLSASWYKGSLWYGLTDSCIPTGDSQPRSCARLTELNTSTPGLVQDMNYGANGQYYFYPAVTIDSSGGLDVIYGYSSATIYPSLAVTGQASGASAGTLAPAQVLKQGNADDTSGRYGDYFGAAIDPSYTTTAWVAGEYHSNATGNCGYCWSTFIGSMTGVADFAVAASPMYLNIPSGSSGTSTITVTPLAGFKGSVSLTATVSTTGPTATLSPASLALPPSGTSALTVNVPTNFVGSFTVTVNATSGTVSHVVTVIVTPNGVQDFSISSVSGVTTPVYSIATVSINLASIYGFSGTVSFSGSSTPATSLVQLSFTPSSINLSPGGADSVLLQIAVYSGASVGLYTLTITGSSGQLSHVETIFLLLTPLGSAGNNIVTFAGVTVNSTSSLFFDSPSTGSFPTLSGTVSIVATNSTTGAQLSSTTNLISKQQTFGAVAGGFKTLLVINITAGPYPLSLDMSFNITANTTTTPGTLITTSQVTRNPDVNEAGSVTLGDVQYVNYKAHNNCNQGSSCYDPRADLNADGVINATDVNIAGSYRGAPNYNQYQFALSTNPSTLAIVQGSSGASTLTVTNLLAFAGTVTFSSTAPSGITVSLNPSSISLSGTSTLSISVGSAVAPGQYTVAVTGSSGFTTKSTTLTVNVTAPSSDFTVTVAPSPVDLVQGSSATATITVASIGGFSGKVNVAVTSSFSALTASLSKSSINLSSGGSGTIVLTVGSSTLGIFSVTLTATSGTLSHSINTLVYVTNFVFDNNYSSAAFKYASPGAAITFYMYSEEGAVTVSLSARYSSSLTITFGTNPVNVPRANYRSSIMGIQSNTVGRYTVTVTATSGPLSKSIAISVQVCLTWQNCGNQTGPNASPPTTNSVQSPIQMVTSASSTNRDLSAIPEIATDHFSLLSRSNNS